VPELLVQIHTEYEPLAADLGQFHPELLNLRRWLIQNWQTHPPLVRLRRGQSLSVCCGYIVVATFSYDDWLSAKWAGSYPHKFLRDSLAAPKNRGRPQGRTKTFATALLMLLPRKERGDIECDICDDVKEMRQAGFREISIRLYVLWQYVWATWRLYGVKMLKLLGAIALMDKLGH
jgi:hypothetical protein